MSPAAAQAGKKRPRPSSAPFTGNGGAHKRSGGQSHSSFQVNKKPRVLPNREAAAPAKSAPSSSRGGRRNREDFQMESAKRKAPLTGNAKPMDMDMEIDEDEDEDEEGGFDEDMEGEDVAMDTRIEGGAGNSGQGDANKRMSKAEKAALHAAQPHRTSLLPSYSLLHETLIPLWEEARKSDLTREQRSEKIKTLWKATQGRVKEIARGHKGGRILQTIVKYGGKAERNGIAEELNGQYKQMMESKYSKFLMAKLIRHCPAVRPSIIAEIGPSVPQLLFHSHACSPLSDFYELWATPKEKRLLVRGFYPKEVLLFDELGTGEDAKHGVEKGIANEGLEKALERMKDGKTQERVLEELNEKIVHVFNSPQKEALAQAIFHRVVLEYVTCIYRFLSEADADAKMHAFLEASLESLADIIHTKDGSAVVRMLISRGTAKDRKNILRVLKPHLQKIAEDSEAQTVLFAAFDYVDDTKMMAKAILAEIATLAAELAFHSDGRRVLLYLLVPRSSRFFIPSVTRELEAMDEPSKKTSKKDAAIRRAELKAAISPDLIKLVEEKAEEMLRDPPTSLLLLEILLEANGDKSKAFDAVLGPLKTAYPNPAPVDPHPDPTTSHVLDLSWNDRIYKTLLAGGRFSMKKEEFEYRLTEDERRNFAKAFWAAINEPGTENAVNVTLGNAPFCVVELVSALEDTAEKKKIAKVLCTPSVLTQVEKSWRKGKDVLHKKLVSISA